MSSVKGFILSNILMLACLAEASILVLEYDDKSADRHEEYVQYAACANDPSDCELYMFDEINSEDHHLAIQQAVAKHDVINMSFGFQFEEEPRERRGEPGDHFKQRLADWRSFNIQVEGEAAFLIGLIAANLDKNFVAASGNGRLIGLMYSYGVLINDEREMYPATLLSPNLLTVTAAKHTTNDVLQVGEMVLADYANYGLRYVHVAAAMPQVTREGDFLKGTSFAAPYTSSVIDQIRYTHREVSAEEANRIVMMTVDVKNIESAILASQSLRDAALSGVESEVTTAMTHRKRKVRLALQEELGDILLVKSGGVLNPERALLCAESYATSQGMSLEEACSHSHLVVGGAGGDYQNKLQELWRLREI